MPLQKHMDAMINRHLCSTNMSSTCRDFEHCISFKCECTFNESSGSSRRIRPAVEHSFSIASSLLQFCTGRCVRVGKLKLLFRFISLFNLHFVTLRCGHGSFVSVLIHNTVYYIVLMYLYKLVHEESPCDGLFKLISCLE